MPIVSEFVQWFCRLPHHKFLLEVPLDFMKDKYEMRGLKEFFETSFGWDSGKTYVTQVYEGIGKTGSANCEFDDIFNIMLVDDTPADEDIDDPIF